jgi:hypothetical protein
MFGQVQEIYPFSKMSTLALGPIQTAIRWVQGCFSGGKAAGT